MPNAKPYSGLKRKLVLAFDVGTTYSGIAYAILDPRTTPKIQVVTRFPGQESGDFKIPSVLWYTQDGQVRAAGAEARASVMALAAEDEDLIFVEWFKLHLRPDAMRLSKSDTIGTLPPLPPGKTVVQVFADFLIYLVYCARLFITETHPNGDSLWSSVEADIDLVLSHPNGWEGHQQAKMRNAAVLAGLVPDTAEGQRRLHFVTEGEASLHYCIDSGLATDAVQAGNSVMLVDAGGGTVDLSTYQFMGSDPLSVDEIAPTDCILHGSTRINDRALTFLQEKLQASRFGNEEDIKAMLESFEKSVKPTFKDATERSFLKFGSIRDKDPVVGIRSGQLPLEGTELESLFEPSVIAIVDAVMRQRAAASRNIKAVLLVGGFAASPWLFSRLKKILYDMGLELARPDSHTNKAVAEGAVSFYLDQKVAARVARLTYGTTCVRAYDCTDATHVMREHKLLVRPSGRAFIPDGFSAILKKGTRLRNQDEMSCSFFNETTQPSKLNKTSAKILCYRGTMQNPEWSDMEPECFSTLCTVTADTSRVTKQKQRGTNGIFYEQSFKIVLSCGQTELKAQISWMEKGAEKRGPATIVYDDDIAPAC